MVKEMGVSGVPSNKGMKLTSVEHIGRSQLIPGVGRTGPLTVEKTSGGRQED